MRIVDPKQFKHSPQKPKKRRVANTLLVLLVISGALFLAYMNRPTQSSHKEPEVVQDTKTEITTPIVSEDPIADIPIQNGPKKLRVFTDNEFKVFYDQLLQPDLERVSNPPEISGNVLADARIQEVAEERGYRLRSSPNVDLISVDGYLLQDSVSEPWFDLKSAAKAEGLTMSILSGYRSVEKQRSLYLSRLAATGVTITEVANGTADEQVNEVLITSSIPGYSKHHTGYTFDLLCSGNAFEDFVNSPCNDWLKADNYKVAKEHGFIPSYPPLADSQGPNPEAWEYVYVGTDLLYE